MKKIFFLTTAIVFSLNVFSQPAIQWQKCYGGTSSDESRSIQQTYDGGYIVAGASLSNNLDVSRNHGDLDVWIVKINSIGDTLWTKCLGGTFEDIAFCIKQTNDTGYVFAGYTFSNDGDVSGNNGYFDMWVVKLNNAGVIQWQKCLGGTNTDVANYIEQTSDKGFIAAGYTYSNDSNVTGFHVGYDSFGNLLSDMWIVKLDSAGNINWQKTLGGTGTEVARSIHQTNDGGYVVAGYTDSYNNGDVSGIHPYSPATYDFWIVKLDNTGSIQWQKCFGGSFDEVARDIKQTQDGGYIAVGLTSSEDGDVTQNHGTHDCWVVKLDSSGNLQWQKCFGGVNSDESVSVIQTLEGGYAFAGVSLSNDGDVSGNHNSMGNAPDYWIVKLNNSGTIEWQKCLGGLVDDIAYCIQQTQDAGFIITGLTAGNIAGSGFHGVYDYWIVKLAPDIIGISENEAEENTLSFFPNPATSELVVSSSEFGDKKEIEIYNVLGEEVFKSQISSLKSQISSLKSQISSLKSQISVDVSQLPSGIYFVKVKSEKEERVAKFVKE